MRDLLILIVHLITTVTRLLGRDGAGTIIAESLLLKHQLLILNRSRKRGAALRPIDRVIAGVCAELICPARLLRSAIVLKPSTIMGSIELSCSASTDSCSRRIAVEGQVQKDLPQS